MLSQVMTYIHNWFIKTVSRGSWAISDGTITVDGLQEGQYFRIVGSVFNDGLHTYPATDLHDETFTGEVWGLAVPPDFIKLVNEIEEWAEKNAESIDSPYASESFGGYSYTKSTDVSGGSNTDPANGWQRHFMARLIPYRKLA